MPRLEKLIEELVKRKLIDKKKLNEIVETAKAEKANIEGRIEESNLIEPEQLTKIRAEIHELPYKNLVNEEIDDIIINIIPSEVADNYKIICFYKTENNISVGLTDPNDFKAIEAIDFLAKEENLEVKYYLISKQSFISAFKQYSSLDEELTSAIKTRVAEEEGIVTEKEKEKKDVKEITKSAPVIKIVSVIIRHAVEGRASDIHIEPLQKESRVRYRIDGVLHTSLMLPKSIHNALIARIKVMANLKLDETRIPQDGRIRLIINDISYDFRVSILPLIGTEKVVMRILETSKKAPSLDNLGFQGENLRKIRDNLGKTEGLLLVTGPTGSGKSTTLFSILEIVNQEGVNIVTLEDPVEYQVRGVNQSQIKPEIGYSFANGLRSFLRQDPDIIMVGEIRDEETAELAIHAALTGHLVLSTLHTIDSVGAVTRLMDMKVEPFLLGSTMHTVIAQRLARKLCPHCKEEVKMPADYLDKIKKDIEAISVEYIKDIIKDFKISDPHFHQAKGCPKCGNTGYTGRVAINEVLDINDSLKDMILGGKQIISVEEVRKSQKFVTIEQDGLIKVLQGITTMEEVLRVVKV